MVFQKTDLSTLVNIGETLEKRLNEIGVYCKEDLEKVGPIEAWRRIKRKHPDKPISPRYYLFSLQGALINMRRTELPQYMVSQLRVELD